MNIYYNKTYLVNAFNIIFDKMQCNKYNKHSVHESELMNHLN